MALTGAFSPGSFSRGTDRLRLGAVRAARLMSLTDVVLSLFLFQAVVAVVQLFSVKGSDREAGPFCVRPPSLFTFHSVSEAGYCWLKNSQQGPIEVSAFIKEDSISQWCEFNVCSLGPSLK